LSHGVWIRCWYGRKKIIACLYEKKWWKRQAAHLPAEAIKYITKMIFISDHVANVIVNDLKI
jgi:hypothetical protein